MTWVTQWQLGALVMRAVANCSGYTPAMAKALAAGYLYARRHPKAYERELQDHLRFAGLWYLDLGDDTVAIAGERFADRRYDKQVVQPLGLDVHQPLFYSAVEVTEGLDFTTMDRTAMVWDRLLLELGGRNRVTFGNALEIIEGLQP